MSYFVANELLMLVARFIDENELNLMEEKVVDILRVYSNRVSIFYAAECKAICRLCYYVPLLLSSCSTIGQSFSGLRLAVTSADEKSMFEPSYEHLGLVCVLYVVLPYVNDRKEEIVNIMSLLLEDEMFGSEEKSDSFFRLISRSIWSCWLKLGSSATQRVSRLGKFLVEDVHNLYFMKDGLYLEWPLRLTSTRLISSKYMPRDKMLRALSWVMAFRLTLLVYFSARVLGREIDTRLENREIEEENSSGEEEENREDEENKQDKGPICILCMDTVHQPTVLTLCGHLFCWKCIMNYHNSHDQGIDSLKCPTCRVHYNQDDVRAIHGY